MGPFHLSVKGMLAFLPLMLLAFAKLVSTNNDYSSSSDSSQIQKNVFLLAGQSNMSGRGGVINGTWDGIIIPLDQSQLKTPIILRLSVAKTWVEAKDPLHKDIDVKNTCGVGPGMAFANGVMKKDPSFGVIGLVPCAIGGTKISEWVRGTNLYNQLVRRAEAALQGGGGTIRALLWYQGESDTIDYQHAKLYKMRLERFFTNLRADLQLPALPIIQVALASGQGPYIDVVRKAQLSVDLPNVKTVDAYGLPLEPDSLHLSTSAQAQLGQMLADTFLQSAPPFPVLVQSSACTIFHHFVLDSLLRPFR
ncbi:hypothetical protein ACH5RR_034963 [Cinchona calisaya]|uniref:Sialate O-acetylesterase domain-containing protein n=1 Tax=Cinchona calisaya TaxID=153742 RepID=A0ABD2YCG6_9GENT